jgi:hypothetical protein
VVERDAFAGQFDVSTAFLNGELTEVVYLRLPMELGGGIWRLGKALYGLKQAARAWHFTLRKVMEELGYQVSSVDPCLFTRGNGPALVIVIIHVDDGVCTGPKSLVLAAITEIGRKLDIKQLGEAHVFLGLDIRRSAGGMWLGQEGYIVGMLERFNMKDCKPVKTPIEVGAALTKEGEALAKDTPYAACVGALMYAATMTRPDIAYAVGSLCRYMAAPTKDHWLAAKRVLRYPVCSTGVGIIYRKGAGAAEAYGDADYAADVDTRRSRSGCIVLKKGGPLLRSSKLQTTVATSTCEAEYGAAAAAAKSALWTRMLLGELSGKVVPMKLHCDNTSTLVMMTQPAAGVSGKKHVEVAYQFVRNRAMRGDIEVVFVGTKEQLADMFTKPLPAPRFAECCRAIGVGTQ